jgi:acyl carrier protein
VEEASVNDDEIRARLTSVFQRVLGTQVPLRDDMKAGDLPDWDSVMHVTLVTSVEKEFKVKFKGAEIATMVSVGDLVKGLRAKTGGAA